MARQHLLLVLLPSAIVCGAHAFLPPLVRSKRGTCSLSGNTNNNNSISNEAENLLKYASRLRKEAEHLESSISEKRIASNYTSIQSPEDDHVTAAAVSYKQLSESYWTLVYRFSKAPTETTNDESNDELRARFYSGKVNIHLVQDGYTEFRSLDSNNIQFVKFWGWDEEISIIDDKRYLMFSADVLIPSDSTSLPFESSKSRFYFNVRIDVDGKSGLIELNDGTVTVKRDVVSNSPRLLSFLNPGSILAEFKKCGTFICKPCQPFPS